MNMKFLAVVTLPPYIYYIGLVGFKISTRVLVAGWVYLRCVDVAMEDSAASVVVVTCSVLDPES